VIELIGDASADKDTLVMAAGVELNGNGNTVTITDWTAGNGAVGVDYAIKASQGGIIKNLTISGGRTAIEVIQNIPATLTLENVTAVESVRALRVENNGMDLVVTNCTFAGKASWAPKSALFTNTAFIKNGQVKGDIVEPYTNTVMNGCTFEDGFKMSLTDLNTYHSGQTVTLNNCYVGTTLITAANVKSLLGIEDGSFTAGELFVGTTEIAP